jgi:hypothetical protein
MFWVFPLWTFLGGNIIAEHSEGAGSTRFIPRFEYKLASGQVNAR